MDSPKEPQPTGEFKCQLCGLIAPYTYYGRKPPNTCSIELLEDCYVMKDPFTPDKGKILILGSLCSLCGRSVCVGTVEAWETKVRTEMRKDPSQAPRERPATNDRGKRKTFLFRNNPSATVAPANPLKPVQNLVITPGESWMVAEGKATCKEMGM